MKDLFTFSNFVLCLSYSQVRLSRQPTPFPKDIRDKINQFRNQAIAKGHVSNHHALGEHMVPQHPYQPADEIEAKRHGHVSKIHGCF